MKLGELRAIINGIVDDDLEVKVARGNRNVPLEIADMDDQDPCLLLIDEEEIL